MTNELRLRAFLKSQFPAYDDDMSNDDDLTTVVDSLGLFDLLSFIEREFDVAVPTEDFRPQQFSSIDSILRYVAELQAQ